MTTDHICHCEICTANRALRAVMELPWPDEYKAQLEALDAAVDRIVDKAATDEMDYAWNLKNIGEALGIAQPWQSYPELIITKIRELQSGAAV